MIIERNVFQLKFGKAKDAIALWKQMMEAGKASGHALPKMRILSDLSGSAYTLVSEMHLMNFNEIGAKNYVWFTSKEMQELYQKFIPLCESATREYYNIEYEM